MVIFNFFRSVLYFEFGIGRGMGFRDLNQDIFGFVYQILECVRERILDLAVIQLEDGGVYYQYQLFIKRGNNEIGGNFNDDFLWLIFLIVYYIKEIGDWLIFDEVVLFENNFEKMGILFEYLKRVFYYVVNNLGLYGFFFIGRVDWNDCLNFNVFLINFDELFQICDNKDGKIVEFVMIVGMFVYVGKEFVKLCEKIGNFELAKDV